MILWIIYTLWVMLGVICGVLSARKDTDLPVGLWLCSSIIMFYVPFIVGI